MSETRNIGFWILIVIGILLTIMFLVGQTLALFNYDLTVSLGMQESEEEVGKVGIAWAKGFAFGDSIFYIPLLLAGIIGLLKRKKWGIYTMFGSLAITVYWPIVSLFAIFIERTEITLTPDKYISYSIILPLIAIYGLWGMWYLYKHKNKLVE
ncbi:hypothetical protein ACFLY8_04705 [Halobacteriota archaeon]